ncbi:FxsA family protein [Pseudooceanicola sp. LIPI14-2-Ac024]|uniref:FxsA family protein n=1 Tax=Pseudooceanicola sp. LIPI14-2-Ac024 TaxID=3344875 RepID=UPI0035CF5E25
MWLLLAFIAVPMIEIALFIQVGGIIGLWWTLGIVLATAVIGTYMVKAQGRQVLDQVRRSFNELSDPTQPLAEGAMILFAGAMLLTPGFFTDTVGLLLLIPPVRHFAFRFIKKHVKVQSMSYGFSTGPQAQPRPGQPRTGGSGDVIDGEFRDLDADFEELDPPKRPTHRPSEWTRH